MFFIFLFSVILYLNSSVYIDKMYSDLIKLNYLSNLGLLSLNIQYIQQKY